MGSRYQRGEDPFTRAEEGRGRGPPESQRTPPSRFNSQRDRERGELFDSQRSRSTERGSRSGSGREGREAAGGSRERGQGQGGHRPSSRSHLASAGSSTAEVAGTTGSRRASAGIPTADVAAGGAATGSRRASAGSSTADVAVAAGATSSRRMGASGARVGHVPRNERSEFDDAPPLPPPPGKRTPAPPSPSDIGGGMSPDYVALPGATLSRGNSQGSTKVVAAPPMAAAVSHAPKARCMSRCSFRILAVLLLVLILVPVGVLLFVKSRNQNGKNGKSKGDSDAAHGQGDAHPPPPPAPRTASPTNSTSNSTTGTPPTSRGTNASAPAGSGPGLAPSPWLGGPIEAPGPGSANAPGSAPIPEGLAPGPAAGALGPAPAGGLSPGPGAVAPGPSGFDIVVDPNGIDNPAIGVYKDLNMALSAVPDGAGYMNDTKVLIKAGVYYGQFKLYGKNYVTLVGDPTGETKLTFDKCSDCLTPADLVGTAPLQIRGAGGLSSYITLVNITFENTYGWPRIVNGKTTGPALAIYIASNRTQVFNCKFFGYQDTVDIDGIDTYIKDSLIFGSVDYVFGIGKALLDNVQIIAAGCDPSIACTNNFCCENVVTAPGTQVDTVDPQSTSGFVFINSVVRVAFNNSASRPLLELGRAWRRSAFAAFVKCTLPADLSPLVWGVPTYDASINYQGAEVSFELFGNTVAPSKYTIGPNPSVPPITYLTEADAAKYLNLSWINGPEWIYTPGPFMYPV